MEIKYTLILRIRKVQILRQQEFSSKEVCWAKHELNMLAMAKFYRKWKQDGIIYIASDNERCGISRTHNVE